MKPTTFLVRLFWLLMLVFGIGRISFMLYNSALWPSATDAATPALDTSTWAFDIFTAWWHGGLQDMIVAGALLALPALLQLCGVKRLRAWLVPYYVVMAFVVALVVVGDTVLYEFWRFKLHSVVFAYMAYPEGTANSVSPAFIAWRVAAFVAIFAPLLAGAIVLTPSRMAQPDAPASRRIRLYNAAITLFAYAVLFFTTSVGQAYHSDRLFVNHAAVNPLYSLAASLRVTPAPTYYSYYDSVELDSLTASLYPCLGLTDAEQDTAVAEQESLAAEQDSPTAEQDSAMADQDGPAAEQDSAVADQDAPAAGKERTTASRDRGTAAQEGSTASRGRGTAAQEDPTASQGRATADQAPPTAASSVSSSSSVSSPSSASSPSSSLLRTTRPDVLIVFAESFGSEFVTSLGGPRGTTPEGRIEDVDQQLERLIPEGIWWTNYYSNSFRTDRGTVSTYCGWPAYPDLGLMTMTERHAALPSLPKSLARAGYASTYLYPGQATNMGKATFLKNIGFQQLLDNTAFTADELDSPWGAHDLTSARKAAAIMSRPADQPRLFCYQTISSHEPWDVPYSRLTDKVQNAFAYTDAAIGTLVATLKKSPAWDNLLIIIIPDHGHPYNVATPLAKQRGASTTSLTAKVPGAKDPASDAAPLHPQAFDDPEFFHSPMLWLGGAISGPRTVDVLMNQSDLCATLLAQLGLDHSDYPWSRNVLSPAYTHPFVFSTFPAGILYRDATGTTVYDITANVSLHQQDIRGKARKGPHADTSIAAFERTRKAKALLQITHQRF